MEPLDRDIAKALTDKGALDGPGTVLLVGGDQVTRSALLPALLARDHDCKQVELLSDARTAIGHRRYDVILINTVLPDGAGLDLIPIVQRLAISSKVIMLAEDPSQLQIVEAMRRGAVDFIQTPVCRITDFLDRVQAATDKSRIEQSREDRLLKLRRICKELNTARGEVSEQVDVLCNDLASAYEDISSQMNDVAMAAEFRTLVKQELDVEDLLRTSLEYVLSKTGPTNAAVFLADQQQNFGLGAYVNYDCSRETVSVLLDHLCQAVCPQMTNENEIVSFEDAGEFANWLGIEAGILGNSQVLAFSCHHHDECLAVVVLFRSATDPFEVELASTLDVLRQIFAQQLANVICIHHRAEPQWPEDMHGDDDHYDDYGFGFGEGGGGIAA